MTRTVARWSSLVAGVLQLTTAAAQDPPPSAAEPAPESSSYGARARSRSERGAASVVLNAEQARRAAGALGEPARAITNVPGVGRAGFDSGEVIVWGSTDNETRAYIDGVELPVLFHPGGFRSALHPAVLDSVVFTKGAPGPELGRSLGGAIELETKRLVDDEPHAALAVDTLDASGTLQGAVGPVRVLYGARLGYIDRLTRLVAPKAGDIVPVPAYADGYAKLQLSLGDDETLSAAWLGTHDVWTRGTIAVDPAASRTQTQSRALQLGYLRYERSFADRARLVITPFIESFDRARVSESGSVPWELAVGELRYGLRASYTLPSALYDVQLGLDALASSQQLARYGTLTLPPREGDITVFGQPPGSEVTRDRWTTYDVNVAPHASLRLRLGRWTLTPGVRLEIHGLTTSRVLPTLPGIPPVGSAELLVRPEPRGLVRYDATAWLSLTARAAITHQAPAAEDRSAIFGHPRLGLSKALTLAGGPSFRPLRLLDVELNGFYKRLSGLATRNPTQPLPAAAVLLAEGNGEAVGAELSAVLRPWHGLSGQLSYTLSRSRRQDVGRAERFFDFDQTHLLTWLFGYQLGGFRASGRLRVATGSPRTPVTGSYQNLRDDRSEPIFGAQNSVRLPGFFALDLRVEHAFTLAALSGAVWLDVLNVTNQRNVEDLAYRFDYAAREDVVGLPILAVLGVSAQL